MIRASGLACYVYHEYLSLICVCALCWTFSIYKDIIYNTVATGLSPLYSEFMY